MATDNPVSPYQNLIDYWFRVLIPDLAMIQEAYDLLDGQREAPGT